LCSDPQAVVADAKSLQLAWVSVLFNIKTIHSLGIVLQFVLQYNECVYSLGDFIMATSVRLDQETEQRLDFLASNTGRTKAYYLREIIEQGIEDMEDYYLAANVLERVRKGQEQVHSAADVRRDLGLDD
jgi:RHH-type rel operon transcriptional repressor/antitoxin RelB